MKCHQAEKWMDAALDEVSGSTARGAGLPTGWRAQFDAHLEGCPHCRRQWEALRAADAALRVPRPVRAPEGMLSEFRQRLQNEEAARPTPAPSGNGRRATGWSWLWPLGSLSAAAVAAAVVVLFQLHPAQSPEGNRQSVTAPTPATSRPDERAMAKVPPKGGASALDAADRVLPQVPEAAPRVQPQAPVAPKGAGLPAVTPAAPARPTRRLSETRVALNSARPDIKLKAVERFGVQITRAPQEEKAHPSTRNFALVPQASHGLMRESRDADTRGLANAVPPARAEARGGRDAAALGDRTEGMLAASAPTAKPALKAAAVSGAFGEQNGLASLELDVSPAVLAALQRPVDLQTEGLPVREVMVQLAEVADVPVKVDWKVPQLTVSVQEAGAPLWRVLENVAKQGSLEIYPKDNYLVLRPAEPRTSRFRGAVARSPGQSPAGGGHAPTARNKSELELGVPTQEARGASRYPKGLSGPAGPSGPPGLPGLAGPPGAPGPAAVLQQVDLPDRAVWPSEWGTLPERGFALPRPEDLPASVAEAPAADAAREAPASTFYYQAPSNTAPRNQLPYRADPRSNRKRP